MGRFIPYTEEDIKRIISKYKTIKEFRDNDRFAYRWCFEHKRLDLLQTIEGKIRQFKNKKEEK